MSKSEELAEAAKKREEEATKGVEKSEPVPNVLVPQEQKLHGDTSSFIH